MIRVGRMLGAMDGAPLDQPVNEALAEAHCTLDQLGKGTRARILAIRPSPLFGTLDSLVTLRLKELGFLPGATLSVLGFGLLWRDPIAVRVGGTKFALRRAEASKIVVSVGPEPAR